MPPILRNELPCLKRRKKKQPTPETFALFGRPRYYVELTRLGAEKGVGGSSYTLEKWEYLRELKEMKKSHTFIVC